MSLPVQVNLLQLSRRGEMAGLIASGIIKWTASKLASFVSAPIGPSSSDEQQSSALRDVQILHRTMARVQRTLSSTDVDRIRSESERLRLRELQQFAYDAQDAIDEYKFEFLRRRMMDDPNNHGDNRVSRKRMRKGDKMVLAVYSFWHRFFFHLIGQNHGDFFLCYLSVFDYCSS
jgi:hypothetical protein